MDVRRKCVIEKVKNPVDGHKYNVQVWTSVDGGKNYYYCGVGRFCKSKRECKEFIRIYKKEYKGVE